MSLWIGLAAVLLCAGPASSGPRSAERLLDTPLPSGWRVEPGPHAPGVVGAASRLRGNARVVLSVSRLARAIQPAFENSEDREALIRTLTGRAEGIEVTTLEPRGLLGGLEIRGRDRNEPDLEFRFYVFSRPQQTLVFALSGPRAALERELKRLFETFISRLLRSTQSG